MLRHLLVTTALCGAGTAYAQSAELPPPGRTQPAPVSAQNQTQPESGIADIVVTAARRSENVQKAALSIQAISRDALDRAGVTRPEDLNALAPGVSIATGGNYPQTYIRGVGNYATNTYAEGAVAYNLDGIYISRGWATRGTFFDLDRVEVLKGPQGTLYGRNASGGALNIITVKPRLGVVEGFVEGEVGNYDLYSGTGAINLPAGDSLAIRASGQIVRRDGYLSDGYDDAKSESARIHALWEPTTDFSILLTGGYQHIHGMGAAAVVSPSLPGSRWRGPSDAAVVAIIAGEPSIGGLLPKPDGTGYVSIKAYSVGGELKWDLGPATLTVLPAYRNAKLSDRTYVPGFRVTDNEQDRQTSVEARLANESDRLKWVLGGYFFDEDQFDIPGRRLLLVEQGVNGQIVDDFRSNIRSYAAFGQATLSITDALRITGGLRYTYERKTQDGFTVNYGFPNSAPPPACANPAAVFDPNTPTPPLFCALTIPLRGRLSYNSVTYKAGFEYDLAPRSLLYGNVSSGFKSGGFIAGPEPNTFDPEKLQSFEVGVKNRFLDNRLQFNLELFYWKYKDHQEAHLGPTTVPGFFAFLTENAGKAKSYGADLDIVFQPNPENNLSVKVQYNKSKYDSFLYTYPTGSFGPPITGCAAGPLVAGQQTIDCSGFQLVRAPTWNGVVGYDHIFDLGSAGKIDAGASMQFASSSYLSIDFLPSTRQESYATFDLDLTYTAPDARWSLAGYVRNVTKEGVFTQSFRYPFVSAANGLADPDGLIFSSIRPPRTFGARLRYNF